MNKKTNENEFVFERFEALYPPNCWENEIKKLIGFVSSGNSAEIIGIPGVGRSNLLGVLSYNRACRQHNLGDKYNDFHFVIMNFTEMRKKNEMEVLKFFFLSIVDSLKERKMAAEAEIAQKMLKESFEIQDQQVILQGLKKLVDYISIEKKLTLVFLVDRFEEFVPYVTPEFFTDLRALRNRAKYKFSVVFSVNRPFQELLDPLTYADFNEFLAGNEIYLPLKDPASLNFRIGFLQMKAQNKITEEEVNKVLSLTSGHGKLTRLSIEALMETNEASDLKSFLLGRPKINSLFQEIWKGLTPSEQNYLETFDPELKSAYLEKTHILTGDKISIPLFEEFVEAQKNKPTETKAEKITYNPETHEIKDGDKVLSDSLTASEYKLLKFLVENEGKILERDEIINAVWKDLSSTAGVSEQALDQLIFRVRKKIEENPNSPTHLQTIKGRGFKFTS